MGRHKTINMGTQPHQTIMNTKTLTYLLFVVFSSAIIASSAQHTRGDGKPNTRSGNNLDHTAAANHDSGNNLDHTAAANKDLDNINSDVNTLLHKYHNVVYAAATLVGFVFTFVGYKLFPATMFLAGSAAGGIGSYILVDSVVDDTYIHKVAIIVGVSVTCALIAGVLALKLRKLGVFLAGAFGGVVGAVALNNAFLINYTSPIVSVPNFYLYVAAVLLGSIAGVLALKLERPILILTTSVVGSFCTVYGTKYFIELEKVVPVTTWSSPQVWIYLSAFLVLLIAGLLIQFSSTKKPRNLNGERRTSLLANDYSSVHIESKNAIVYAAPNNDEGNPSSGSIITSV